ncbi:MobH family relaxase [Pseudoduganella sp. UC29_106]|uniref:MobH family relaxase n=1 Tax=Pseudoduganella sp. UC29_106 TaxID=3374553 RepID=UPI00375697BE
MVPQSGLQLQSVDEMLTVNRELIGRIKLCYGCDAATFSADLLAPIRRYLEYVNQLPATMDSYFSDAGGLARIGLETAFYALQATDSQIFAGRATISNRRVLEPRWRRATFIAGLCNEIHRTLSHVRVSDAHGREWHPYLTSLTRWSKEHGVSRPQLHWVTAQETRALGLFALPMIITPETMCDLAKDNATIVPHMLATIAGATMYHEHNVMYRLVGHAAALVIQRNLRAAGASGSGKPWLHMARYLVEAMRELVLSQHGWQPNIGRSRLWYGQDGLFLIWPNGINDVVKLLEDERLPGIPDSASGVLDILEGADLVTAQSSECRVWTIYPPESREPVEAIRFAAPATVLAVLTPRPTPLEVQLTVMPADPRPAAESPDSDATDTTAPEQTRPGGRPPFKAPATIEGWSSRRQPAQLRLPEMDDVPAGCEPQGREDDTSPATAAPVRTELARERKGKARQVGVALSAPMRLNPDVARVLADIVGTLAGTAPPACHVDAGILFVPLGELAKRGVDARHAQRALGDAGMLSPQPNGERIHTREVSGAKVPGLLLDGRCITGSPPAAAQNVPPVPEG